MIKKFLKKWLDIVPAPDSSGQIGEATVKLENQIKEATAKLEKKINGLLGKMNAYASKSWVDTRFYTSITNAETDSRNALLEVLMMQQKFDCLADMLGVVIAADIDGGSAIIESVIEGGLLVDAEKIVADDMSIKKMLTLQRRLLTQQLDILSRAGIPE